jgi:hypothetical protein
MALLNRQLKNKIFIVDKMFLKKTSDVKQKTFEEQKAEIQWLVNWRDGFEKQLRKQLNDPSLEVGNFKYTHLTECGAAGMATLAKNGMEVPFNWTQEANNNISSKDLDQNMELITLIRHI